MNEIHADRPVVELARQGWTDANNPDIVRIDAVDLQDAQRKTAAIRAADPGSGGSPTAVLVAIEVLVSTDRTTVRAELNRLTDIPGSTSPRLRYVGTPSGLAGLIGDIVTAHVADGVTLLPLSGATMREIFSGAMPLLQQAGFHAA